MPITPLKLVISSQTFHPPWPLDSRRGSMIVVRAMAKYTRMPLTQLAAIHAAARKPALGVSSGRDESANSVVAAIRRINARGVPNPSMQSLAALFVKMACG